MNYSPLRRPEPARDPISIGIAAITAAEVVTGIAIGFEAAALVGTAVLAAGSVAVAAAAQSSLANAQRQSTLAGGLGISRADNGLRLPVRQPIPPQRLVLGRVVTSGALLWQRSDPPFIWLMYEIASHRCGDFESLILNGVSVPLEDPGTGILRANSAPFFNGTTRFIELSYRNGAPGQVIDPLVARDFPDMPETFRQRRSTTVVLKANYGASDDAHKALYGSENNFNPLFRFNGALLPDPRVPGFDPQDESTWVQSRNASLGLIRYLIHPWPNMRLVEPNEINWDLVAEAADIDDKWVGMKDGSVERNHTADGVILSIDDPLETCKALLTACDGLLINHKGKYYVLPGDRREPIGTIHQDMIAGAFEFQSESPDRNLINTVKTEFIAPDREYNTVVGPVIQYSDLIAQDGRVLETTLSLPFTEGDARAQRLGNRKLLETRQAKSLSGLFTIEARKYKAGDVVRVEFRDFPEVNGLYQIRKTARDASLSTVQIDMVAWSNDRFEWFAPSDQKDFELDEDVLAAEAA